jgi:hypothetical protein
LLLELRPFLHVGSAPKEDVDLRIPLPYATEAFHQSFDNQHKELCLEGTRSIVLEEIRQWANSDNQQNVFWLNGMAGTGKSTITRTLCKSFHESHRLGASFFFSRGGKDVGTAHLFVTTVAIQLADRFNALKSHMVAAIRDHADLATQSLEDQWNKLVKEPMSKLDMVKNHLPILIVIDALDECADDGDIRKLLKMANDNSGTLRSTRFRVFITSRPEVPIRLGFRDMDSIVYHDLALHDVSQELINSDIALFFQHAFTLIKKDDECGDLPSGWPTLDDIQILVVKAHKLFIYASTVYRFIKDSGVSCAEDTLAVIISPVQLSTHDDGRPRDDNSSFHDLDKIYTQMLERSIKLSSANIPDFVKCFRLVVGTIVMLYEPLSVAALASLVDKTKPMVNDQLRNMYSVLNIPRDQTTAVSLLHPSFRDFLIDLKRCGPTFHVMEAEAHQELASHCIRVMNEELPRYANFEEQACSGLEVKLYEGPELPAEFRYSCLYWVQHLIHSRNSLADHVLKFMKTEFLHWLSAMRILGHTAQSILIIVALEKHLVSRSRGFLNPATNYE